MAGLLYDKLEMELNDKKKIVYLLEKIIIVITIIRMAKQIKLFK